MRGMRPLLVIFLAASATLALAEKNYDQAKAELLAAFDKSSIQKEGSPPFELTVNFMLTFDAPVSGTYKLSWMSPSVWRLDINMPGYQEKKVRNGDKEWTDRNLKFPPLRVPRPPANTIANSTTRMLTIFPPVSTRKDPPPTRFPDSPLR